MRTTVYFATNRVVRGPANAVASYTAEMVSPADATAMTYGVAFVENVDVAGNAQGDVAAIGSISQGGFSAAVSDELAHAGRTLLVFVHGFDNSFSDALTRAAFNREWLAASGVAAADATVLAFSWPSLGDLLGFPILQSDYLRDQTVAGQSGTHLMHFFDELKSILLAARANNFTTCLLAHSMGNLALQQAVETWFLQGRDGQMLFDHAILAAGDCRYDGFTMQELHGLSGLVNLAGQVSIYYSGADQVLQLSMVVNLGAFRLGQDGPRERSDTTVFPQGLYRMVDCTGVRDYPYDFLASHQYYRQSPQVRANIAAVLGG